MTDDRVRLPKGIQKEFLNRAIERGNGVAGLAIFLKVSARTIRDWRREKFLMPYQSLMKVSRTYTLPLPEDMQREKRFWYVAKGARHGGLASYEKQGGFIGNPVVRKQKWREWWEREGKFIPHSPIGAAKQIEIPTHSTDLAEFTGIVLGDGGVTNYQVTITLNSNDEREYGIFVANLIKNLFGVIPAIHYETTCYAFTIKASRKALVAFCGDELGLFPGDKIENRIDIPDWVKEKEKYRIACIRGLVDTDGSVYNHRYRVNNRQYSYKKIDFCSLSRPLLTSVFKILKGFSLRPKLLRNKIVQIDNEVCVKKYFDIIGSSNSKHLKRYLN